MERNQDLTVAYVTVKVNGGAETGKGLYYSKRTCIG